ncbi:MAG: protein translocase subunit SecF [Sporichthyaceae bacterium]|nr:protein translocase subunit SecF [Sporichthyaceae bacterium]
MSRLGDLGGKLYRGEVSFDFVGNRKRWYLLSAVLLLVSALSLATRELDLGVEFKGGAVYQVTDAPLTVEQAREAARSAGVDEPIVQELPGENRIRVQVPEVSPETSDSIRNALADRAGIDPGAVNVDQVGASWGEQIAKRALLGLIVFFIAVLIYLAAAFDLKMAAAAFVSLLHDVFITVGIYSLVGFTVTPATVIGVLTILGYSLYDTVVVFDKVRENTRGLLGSARHTYSQAANLAINQTVVRSINTSVIALLPVASILFIGTWFLGAGVLKDLALALFVGIAVGTYSSIFIATPLLAQLKEREPQMQALARRVASRGARAGAATGAVATAGAPVSAASAGSGGKSGGKSGGRATGAKSDSTAETAAGNAGGSGGTRPVPRQQPQRSGSKSKRRPSGKKRR